jgi:hypothetical protein
MKRLEIGLSLLSMAIASPIVPEKDKPKISSCLKREARFVEVSHTDCHSSSKFCSAYPGCGKYVRLPVEAKPRIWPVIEINTSLELVVPQSTANKQFCFRKTRWHPTQIAQLSMNVAPSKGNEH